MEKVFWNPEQFKKEEVAKPEIFEIAEELENSLSRPENFAVVDKVIQKEGASQELTEKLEDFSDKLGSKVVAEENSVEDVMRNFQTSLFGFVERIKKKGAPDQSKEKIIKDNFNALRDYVDLLDYHKDFEKAELNNEDGFLKGKIKKEEFEKLRANKVAYVAKCKEILEERERKMAA